MPTSTYFMVLVLLSEITLYGQSVLLWEFQRELCRSVSQTTEGDVNLVSAYAPTLGVSPDVKDSFYEALADTVRLMNIDQPLFILGDFNARVGNQWIL